MSEQERIELLKEVARVAPRLMKLTFRTDPHKELRPDRLGDDFVHFSEDYCTLALKVDPSDAQACFAMLDAMESAGWYPRVGVNPYRNYWCSVYDHSVFTPKIQTKGATRAEAVARAFVAVFGDKEKTQ